MNKGLEIRSYSSSEKIFENNFHSFEFVVNRKNWTQIFSSEKRIKVILREIGSEGIQVRKQMDKNNIVEQNDGFFEAEIPMEALLKQNNDVDSTKYSKTLDSFFELHRKEENSSEGEVRVRVVLEDLGPMERYRQAEERITQEILDMGLQREGEREGKGGGEGEEEGGTKLNVGLDTRGRSE